VEKTKKVGKCYEVMWAGTLALHLALARKGNDIQIEDYFSGLYLIGRDALMPYWTDSASLDAFVRNVCGLTEPIWFYWIDFHQALKSRYAKGVAAATYSKDLAQVIQLAQRLVRETKATPKRAPLLGVEHIMAAIAAHPRLRFTRRLLASGVKPWNYRRKRE
jgi:hypothetical protein